MVAHRRVCPYAHTLPYNNYNYTGERLRQDQCGAVTERRMRPITAKKSLMVPPRLLRSSRLLPAHAPEPQNPDDHYQRGVAHSLHDDPGAIANRNDVIQFRPS